MAEEADAIVGRAPTGESHLAHAEGRSLGGKTVPQINVPGSGSQVGHATPRHDFRSYFIASTTYTYSAMHYDIGRSRSRGLEKPAEA